MRFPEKKFCLSSQSSYSRLQHQLLPESPGCQLASPQSCESILNFSLSLSLSHLLLLLFLWRALTSIWHSSAKLSDQPDLPILLLGRGPDITKPVQADLEFLFLPCRQPSVEGVQLSCLLPSAFFCYVPLAGWQAGCPIYLGWHTGGLQGGEVNVSSLPWILVMPISPENSGWTLRMSYMEAGSQLCYKADNS